MNSRRWRRRRSYDVAELNITAFMNLMVILVPFLLITAVFSRLTILELSLPAPSDATAEVEPAKLQLEIVIRNTTLEIGDINTGLLKLIPTKQGAQAHDLDALSEYLQQVKANFPDKTDATILLEPDIDYDTLVQVMDTVRVYSPAGFTEARAELFPDISIGDAAIVEQASAVAGEL